MQDLPIQVVIPQRHCVTVKGGIVIVYRHCEEDVM